MQALVQEVEHLRGPVRVMGGDKDRRGAEVLVFRAEQRDRLPAWSGEWSSWSSAIKAALRTFGCGALSAAISSSRVD